MSQDAGSGRRSGDRSPVVAAGSPLDAPVVAGGPVIGRPARPRPRVADRVPRDAACVSVLVSVPAADVAAAEVPAHDPGTDPAVAPDLAAVLPDLAAVLPDLAVVLPDLAAVLPDRAAGEGIVRPGLAAALRREPLTDRPGDLLTVPLYGAGPRSLHLVGTGPAGASTGSVAPAGPADGGDRSSPVPQPDGAPRYRAAGAALGRRLASERGEVAALVAPAGVAADHLGVAVEALLLARYRFRRPSDDVSPGELVVVAPGAVGDVRRAVEAASARADAVWLARDLANTPPGVKSPAWLAGVARALAAPRRRRLTVRVRDVDWLRRHGFGGLLAVGAGSTRPPCLVEVRYTPRRPHGASPPAHVVLVGKGITFDSGGLSLKPLEAMTLMKTDMAAAAAVMAVLTAAARLGVRVPVTAYLPIADNMPSGSAMRPGDVVRHPDGRTTEILNTDAEGRLVLADVLAWTGSRPGTVTVDVATLTGAVRLALGRRYAGLFTAHDALAEALRSAGARAGEPVCRLPLTEDYLPWLESDVADQTNVARSPSPGAGATLAALYLQRFAGDRAWAHLDIAGTGRATADDGEIVKGATGYGVRLLLTWLAGLG